LLGYKFSFFTNFGETIMKKVFLLSLMISALITFGSLSSAYSYPYSGEYMFTESGNDPGVGSTASLDEKIEDWFLSEKNIIRDISLDFFDKVDSSATSSGSGLLTVTYDTSYKFGTWAASQPIEFYVVKGGAEFALYWIDGLASEGYWSTEHLTNGGGQVPSISHLSAYNDLDTPAPVPEPATIVLLGTGFLGLAVVGRKKIKK
jgi:hypothetical protein